MGSYEAADMSRFLYTDEDCAASPLAREFAGEPVLVTGAGGSIGSALARTLAASGAGRVILLDSSEAALFGIHRELAGRFGDTSCEPVLGSVDDEGFLDDVFGRFRPRAIFHAAAYKHVPMLEANPFAAVQNNAMGTWELAQAAIRHAVPRFVLVSTDKAVYTRSIMGASKRIAELIVTSLSGRSCRMTAVRLGNVISSSNSVVPLFREQIASGGPVTVTHPDASRYFVTMRDAVEAIIVGATSGADGQIMVPHMGEPVKIADLARFLIERSGRPDVAIEFTGLRPGDKIREDLRYDFETTVSANDRFVILRPGPAPRISHVNTLLKSAIESRDLEKLLSAVIAAVPEYATNLPFTRAGEKEADASRSRATASGYPKNELPLPHGRGSATPA